MVMNIREYIENIKDTESVNNPPTDYDWRRALEKQGYPNILLSREGHLKWQEVHAWCEEKIGKDHYVWTGSRFWFDRIEDATLFALKWS